MALGDYVKGVPKPTTSYNSLVQSPVKSSGTPLIAPSAPKPAAPYYGGTVPSPAAYQAPPAYPQVRQTQQAPIASPSFGIGTPNSGGMGGAPAPEPASKPVMSESDWLSGDTDYQDMTRELDTNLADFLKRISTQETQFDDDYKLSEQGFERNKAQGMLGVGEDFTSRGLANSGLFADASREASANFERQGNGMRTAKDRTKADFETQRSDKSNATRIGKDNAKSDALKRMSMSQAF